MIGVVQNSGGTAHSAFYTGSTPRLQGITVGGKTGTAEFDKRSGGHTVTGRHAWFIGFAPYDKPRIAVCVFVEHAGHGGDVAAPIARQVIAKYLGATTASAPPEVTGSAD